MTAKPQVGLIGVGFVGGALKTLLEKAYDVQVYDPPKGFNNKEHVNACATTFVCVPTPMQADKTCDLSYIEDALSWCDSDVIVIKSTVPPGTTAQLADKTGKRLVHNPEFLREQTAIDDMLHATRTLLGGDKEDCVEVCQLYQKVYDHDMVYVFTTSTMTEFIKYATNTFFATKVALINEYYEICKLLGLDYNEFREHWLLEPRVGRHHTLVTEERGFGGTCLPKDLNALITTIEALGYDSALLKSVWNANCKIRKEFVGREYSL